jgi:hypothetical protein
MSTITVWMIIALSSSGHRVELPPQYYSEAECVAAAQTVPYAHPGTSASCVTRAIAVSEERARQVASEQWWRSRPLEAETRR